MVKSFLIATVVMFFMCTTARADYTTVNLSGFANNNLALGEGTYPTGLSTGNQGINVPFSISGSNGVMNSYISPTSNASGTLNLVSYALTGQTTFYALLNNIYGSPGLDEYDVTISTTQGPSVKFSSVGGVDTRDYNQNVFTNTLAPTTLTWFNNGVGQRLDLRQFTLPTSLSADTISGITITQGNNGDLAVLSGLTFSTAAGIVPTAVPEPATIVVVGMGLAGLLVRRQISRIGAVRIN